MIRVRFFLKMKEVDFDPRPIHWPVAHPYWVSGQGDDYFILVSYADDVKYISHNWPEAYEIDVMGEREDYTFTSRFPKPKWWSQDAKERDRIWKATRCQG